MQLQYGTKHLDGSSGETVDKSAIVQDPTNMSVLLDYATKNKMKKKLVKAYETAARKSDNFEFLEAVAGVFGYVPEENED